MPKMSLCHCWWLIVHSANCANSDKYFCISHDCFTVKAIQWFAVWTLLIWCSRKCLVCISSNLLQLWYGCGSVNTEQWGWCQRDKIKHHFLCISCEYEGSVNPAWEWRPLPLTMKPSVLLTSLLIWYPPLYLQITLVPSSSNSQRSLQEPI